MEAVHATFPTPRRYVAQRQRRDGGQRERERERGGGGGESCSRHSGPRSRGPPVQSSCDRRADKTGSRVMQFMRRKLFPVHDHEISRSWTAVWSSVGLHRYYLVTSREVLPRGHQAVWVQCVSIPQKCHSPKVAPHGSIVPHRRDRRKTERRQGQCLSMISYLPFHSLAMIKKALASREKSLFRSCVFFSI